MIVHTPPSPTRAPTPRAILTLAVTALLLAGCSPSDSADAGPPTPASAPTPSAPAPASPTVGGDGSAIQLDPLIEADLREAALAGELACSFATDGQARPLLLAMGVVGSDDAAQGIVKVAGYVERIGAPGGFDGMLEGATFAGQGKTIEIALTGASTGGGESPPRPATLTYQRADGASREVAGVWQCGP